MVGNRNDCFHTAETAGLLLVRWCVRCSGWAYSSLLEGQEQDSESSTRVRFIDRGFWPAEDAGPEDFHHATSRLLRASQELEQDLHELRLF